MNEPADNPFAQGPIKAERGPEIRDGKRREKLLDRLRLQGFWPVYLAFVILALRPPLAEPHTGLAVLRFGGLALALLGVLMRIWSLGYLLKKAELATAGPYGRTRNPLYVGTWLIGCGLALNTAWPFNVGLLVLFNVLFYFIYRAQIGIEEEMLQSIYGEPYAEYCRRVPRFFPSIGAWHTGAVSTFNLGRAFRNNAWEPVAGTLVLFTLQAASWGLLWPIIDGATFAQAWQRFIAGAWIGL